MESLSMLLTTRGKYPELIVGFGDGLWKSLRSVEAAHCCYIFADMKLQSLDTISRGGPPSNVILIFFFFKKKKMIYLFIFFEKIYYIQ